MLLRWNCCPSKFQSITKYQTSLNNNCWDVIGKRSKMLLQWRIPYIPLCTRKPKENQMVSALNLDELIKACTYKGSIFKCSCTIKLLCIKIFYFLVALNRTTTTASKAHFCVLLYMFIKEGLFKENHIFCQKSLCF